MREYEVEVTFMGSSSLTETYSVEANDEDEACAVARDAAGEELDVTEIIETGDGYEVTVNFCGFIGGDETYLIEYAEDEDEAKSEALSIAFDDLSAEVVEEYIDDEEDN